MLRTCRHCGIVSDNHICPYKKQRAYNQDTIAGDIRHTYKWTQMSKYIRERDNYLCQVCRRKKYDTLVQYNSKDVEVHHIVPIEEDDTKAYNEDNLISLCKYHHELAEKGMIPRDELRKYIG